MNQNQKNQIELKNAIKIYNQLKRNVIKLIEMQENQLMKTQLEVLNETLNKFGQNLMKINMQAKLEHSNQPELNTLIFTDISPSAYGSVTMEKCNTCNELRPILCEISESRSKDEEEKTMDSDEEDSSTKTNYESANESFDENGSTSTNYESACELTDETNQSNCDESETISSINWDADDELEEFTDDDNELNEFVDDDDEEEKNDVQTIDNEIPHGSSTIPSNVTQSTGIQNYPNQILKFSEMNQSREKLIFVEGNIGAGKTTLLKFLAEFDNIEVIYEPLDQWSDLNGSNLLQLMYSQPKKWAFSFQSYVLLTYLKIHFKPMTKIRIIERSIYSARNCFMENLFQKKLIKREQYNIMQEWYNFIEQNFNLAPDLVIYLNTNPENAFYRCVNRNRSEEQQLDFNHFRDLHKHYENWLSNNNDFPVLVLNGNVEENLMEMEYEKCLKYLNINNKKKTN